MPVVVLWHCACPSRAGRGWACCWCWGHCCCWEAATRLRGLSCWLHGCCCCCQTWMAGHCKTAVQQKWAAPVSAEAGRYVGVTDGWPCQPACRNLCMQASLPDCSCRRVPDACLQSPFMPTQAAMPVARRHTADSICGFVVVLLLRGRPPVQTALLPSLQACQKLAGCWQG